MDIFYTILGYNFGTSLLVILNVILVEALLSLNNATVLSTMVADLPDDKQRKATRYGIFLAFALRGLLLLLAGWLVSIWWLKPLVGFYLIYLSFSYFLEKQNPSAKNLKINTNSKLFNSLKSKIGSLGAAILLVEIVSFSLSLNQVLVAATFSDHIYAIMIGVFIGIIVTRWYSAFLTKLVAQYILLKDAVYAVVMLLGIKMFVSFPCEFIRSRLCRFLHSQASDFWLVIVTTLLLVLPFVIQYFKAKYAPVEPTLSDTEPTASVDDKKATDE